MIIGFAGHATAGKSEAANALVPDFKKIAFADKLREFLYTLDPIVIPGQQAAFSFKYGPSKLRSVIDQFGWDGYKTSPYADSVRQMIQTVGTECGRGILGEDVWVNATLNPIMTDSSVRDWAIHDVRFPNEAKAIKEADGYIIRINKPGVGPLNNHPSETSLNDWPFDHVINNDEGVDTLHYLVRRYVRGLPF